MMTGTSFIQFRLFGQLICKKLMKVNYILYVRTLCKSKTGLKTIVDIATYKKDPFPFL